MEEECNKSISELSTDEDEVEPKFKYCRMTNHLQKIVNEDAISCVNVASRFMCVGTLWGRIYLLDHQGNEVETSTSFPNHMISINHISVDSKGEFIASCSDDGMIHINGLYTNDSNLHLNLGVAIKFIELDPDHYKSGSGRKFILGDNRLTLFEKSFLKSLKSSILSESEGEVAAIKWNNNFVAWASSNLGVRVYDLNERCSLGLLKWEEPTDGKLSDYRCNLMWCNSTTLLIGWVDTIRICVIRKRNSVEVSTRNVPGFIVDPISSFKTDFILCGLAPMESISSNQLVVLGYTKLSSGGRPNRPVLCALEYKSNDYTEICIDTLSIKGYENYTHLDYHLDYLAEENQYFIVSPKDIVVASLYEADDRVQWLIEHGNLERRNAIRETWLNLRPRIINNSFYNNEVILLPGKDTNGRVGIDSVETQRLLLQKYKEWLLLETKNIKVGDYKVKHYFAIATKNLDSITRKSVQDEQSVFNDLLLIPDLVDSYENLTDKLLKSLFVIETQIDYNYLFKSDDDTYVKLDILSQDLLDYHQALLSTGYQNNWGLYWGYFNGRAQIKNTGKWKETSYNLCDSYLPYALGGCRELVL
uniref:CSON006888 protein n=1 Tax=Culicoides sonorensis TaxID=179676 RepID=A0A336KE33_CULSO